jgi:hypothetical protein
MSSFEDRLWSELVRDHGDEIRLHGATTTHHPARRRRRPAVLAGTALSIAGVTAAAVLALTATTAAPPAYAVSTNSDGTVTVTLNDISALTALNAELAGDGLHAKAVPLSATCPTRGFPHAMPAGTKTSTYTLTIVPADIPAGFTAVVAASESSAGQVQLVQGAWRSPGSSCVNSTPLVVHPIDRAAARARR